MNQLAESSQRIVPQQPRAKQRIALILQAAEHLLAAGDEVNTSSISRQAGIPVGSIYRYFPNMLGIYRSLFEDINGQLRDKIEAVVENARPEQTWDMLFDEILAAAMALYSQRPGYGNLLFAMSVPALLEVRQDCIDKTSEIFASRWREGHDGFHDGDVDEVAVTASRLFTFMEQCYFEALLSERATTPVEETVKALKAYLSIYLRA
ncbi:MAG: TetR/AcrR family transcriptional regulator [Pseudomonadota bacterium]